MAGKRAIQGIEKYEEISKSFAQRDVRPWTKRAGEWLARPGNAAVCLAMAAGAAYWYPALADLVGLAMIPFVLWAVNRREKAPLKIPAQAAMPDWNDLHPATGRPVKGQGIFFLGNELSSGKEIWLTNDDCRQHFLVVGTTGAGKSVNKFSSVHTPTGWRRIGDLTVGDEVSCPVSGEANTVTGVFPQGVREMWELDFADGRKVRADAEHLWEVHHKHWSGKRKPGVSRAGMAKPRVITTRELRERMLSFPKGVFAIPLTAPLEKPETDLPIPPYALGALIGDGHLSVQQVSSATCDSHVAERTESDLRVFDVKLKANFSQPIAELVQNACGSKGGTRRLRSLLSDLGLLGHLAWDKFIPAVYKESSLAQRWALVQGLMDTDGTCDARKPVITFRSTSERLVRDLQEVVWGLGGIARISAPRRKTYTHGEKKTGRPSWLLYIRHPEPWRFFSLPRKVELAAKPHQHADRLKLAVKSITPAVSREEAVCIMVDHPRHLYAMDHAVVTHNTELLVGFAANAVSWGSGLLYCDGKGDVSLFAKMYALCRRWGREDDLLVLNFMNGNKDSREGEGVRSNTLNPFSTGASDGLTQMIVGLMPESGGEGAMWKGRAVSMLTGLMKALVWLRDKGERELNVSSIRDAMLLKSIIELADPAKWPNMPAPIRASVKAYLNALPGYQDSKGANQAQTTLDQHGYLQMQFSQIFGSLSDVYGHIFGSAYGQIDMNDVVLNRRILVIMLPALEKSGDEIANLGKIVTANLKGMMGSTLGSKLEGGWEDVVENRPTSAPSPFIVILDEVGYYTVDGMALMAAQARSLGFSMVYASQDLPAMERNNAKEAASIIANTNTKVFMRTEEMEKTGRLAVASGGQARMAAIQDMERRESEAGVMFRPGDSARFDMRDRIDTMDLKAQGAGEMTVIHKAEVIRAKAFYADPAGSLQKKKLALGANHFIEVHRPDPQALRQQGELEACAALLTGDADAHEARMEAAATEAVALVRENASYGDEVAAAALAWERAARAATERGARHDGVALGCVAVANLHRAMERARGGAAVELRRAGEARRRPAGLAGQAGLGGEQDRLLRTLEAEEDESLDIRTRRADSADLDDFLAPARREPTVPRPPVRTDPDVRHSVSVDGREVWAPERGLADQKALLRCLADLDEDEGRTPEELDGMIDRHMGMPEGPRPTPPQIRDAARMAAEFEDRARRMEETPSVSGRPPRREPPPSTPPAAAAWKGGEKGRSDSSGEGGKSTSGGGSGSPPPAGGGGGAVVEDFIAQIMGGSGDGER